jgi:ElaB/YqjD/DUF883 family membrane-anchored ribosome-binding protein
MNRAELSELEHEVEEARARFAGSLARVRSPTLVEELKAELIEVKDEAVSRARDAAQDTFSNLVREVKERAAANPAGALAIGAGLLWHFLHRPPVASMLVGVGAVSLMRTDPQQNAHGAVPGSEMFGRAAQYGRERLQTITEAAKETAREAASSAGTAAGHAISQTAEAARQTMSQAAETARQTMSQSAETVRQVADRTYEFAGELTRNSRAGDNVLLGAAALAIGTAIVISYRRGQQPQHEGAFTG